MNKKLRWKGTFPSLFLMIAMVKASSLLAFGVIDGDLPKTVFTHYDVQLKIDIKREFIATVFNINYQHEGKQVDSLQLFLNNSMTIEKLEAAYLKDFKIQAATFSDKVNEITLLFSQNIKPGDRIPIQIHYAGQLRQEDMPFAVDLISEQWLELSVNSFWHPIFKGFLTNFTADVTLELPGNFEVVSSGKVSRKGDRFLIHNAVPQVDIAFCASPKFLKRAEGKMNIFYTNPEQPFLDALIRYGSQSLTFLNNWLGNNDSIPYGKIVIAPRPETGYARKHFIILSNLKNSDEAHLSNFIAHEFAHFWWLKGDSNTDANWLNESFAEYTALQYQREVLGEAFFQEQIEKLRKRSAGLPPIITEGSNERQSHDVLYHKGPLKLYELEQVIGKKPMQTLLQKVNEKSVKTTETLLSLVKILHGVEIAAGFEQSLKQ